MNRQSLVIVLFLSLILTACDGSSPEPIFDIAGTPNLLYYGGSCGTPVITFSVKGFLGDPYPIYSTYNPIVAYQLFDGGGREVIAGTLILTPVALATPDAYFASQGLIIPDSGATGSGLDPLVLDFGEGAIKFQAIIEAEIRTSPTTVGGRSTGRKRYFTGTKSIAVLPCPPAATVPPTLASTFTPIPTVTPKPTKKPKDDSGGGPPPPPSCSVEPNDPNCVNP